MAPLTRALEVTFQSQCRDGTSVYRCKLDRDWTVGAIPQGGYALGIVIEACIHRQAGTSHLDPVHVTAHFLRPTNVGEGEVHIRLVKNGKTFTTLQAELVQAGITKITSHLIFGDLSPQPSGQLQRTLAPPSPYARRLPLHNHPSTVSPDEIGTQYAYKLQMQWAMDKTTLARNHPNHSTRTTSETVGGGGVEWGAWCQLTSDGDTLKTAAIPFFADTVINLPLLLPESEPAHVGTHKSWFPTIILTVEFKSRIPSSDDLSDRTVGLYCESRFLNDPQGRHNERVEVWTAPSGIGQGEVQLGWREKQYCIAVADQMALMLPMDLNLREGTRVQPKL